MTGLTASRVMRARRDSTCPICRGPIRVGDQIVKCGLWICARCLLDHNRAHQASERPAEPPAGRHSQQEG